MDLYDNIKNKLRYLPENQVRKLTSDSDRDGVKALIDQRWTWDNGMTIDFNNQMTHIIKRKLIFL